MCRRQNDYYDRVPKREPEIDVDTPAEPEREGTCTNVYQREMSPELSKNFAPYASKFVFFVC